MGCSIIEWSFVLRKLFSFVSDLYNPAISTIRRTTRISSRTTLHSSPTTKQFNKPISTNNIPNSTRSDRKVWTTHARTETNDWFPRQIQSSQTGEWNQVLYNESIPSLLRNSSLYLLYSYPLFALSLLSNLSILSMLKSFDDWWSTEISEPTTSPNASETESNSPKVTRTRSKRTKVQKI